MNQMMKTGLEPFLQYKAQFRPMMEYFAACLYEDIPPCTKRQRGYIYGMCRKLNYEEHDLPRHISFISEPREMNIEEAGDAIDRLAEEVDEIETAWYEKYGEKKRYGKNARKE